MIKIIGVRFRTDNRPITTAYGNLIDAERETNFANAVFHDEFNGFKEETNGSIDELSKDIINISNEVFTIVDGTEINGYGLYPQDMGFYSNDHASVIRIELEINKTYSAFSLFLFLSNFL